MIEDFQELVLDTLLKWNLVEQINGSFKLSSYAIHEIENELKRSLVGKISDDELASALICVVLKKVGTLEDEELYQATNTLAMLVKAHVSVDGGTK